MMFGKRVIGALLISFVCLLSLASAKIAQAASGPALLTVVGKIGAGNRGASNDFLDALLNSQDVHFDKAFTFDQRALEALPQHTTTIRASNWPDGFTFEGPLLSDVLKAAGVTNGTTVKVRALDGYMPEIDMDMVNTYPLLLALKANGEYLDIGARGPLWLVFPINDFPALPQEGDANWVWAAFFIEVE